MRYWTEFESLEKKIVTYRNRYTKEIIEYDNNIYTFDIETTSYIKIGNRILESRQYDTLTDDEKESAIYQATMYIWQFSINDVVYYGRTWDEFVRFIKKLHSVVPQTKIIFVHNLSYEFQFLWKVLPISKVFSRKKRKVIKVYTQEYNLEFRCTYQMSATALENLPKMFNLPTEKLTGSLNYEKIRHSRTILSQEELSYCEHDCLVVYEYIKIELEEYNYTYRIPLTSTGHVRRELKDQIYRDKTYREKVAHSINTDPHVYNMLLKAFSGGYTHANVIYANEIIENVDSWDFTSSYPYVLVTHKYPSSEFKKCEVSSILEMDKNKAYLITVKLTKIASKYFNHIISLSKCEKYSIRGGVYDNGRIVSADEITITLTDVDLYLINDWYIIEKIEFIECYVADKNYLPKLFINFILEKYVLKTRYKGVQGEEVRYNIEKGRFNSLYGMSVTNDIRDEVLFNDILGWLDDRALTNGEIQERLNENKEKAFMSFSTGVWVTAYARNNLLRNLMQLDNYSIYGDTDSIKVRKGYDRSVIDKYNDFVLNKLKVTSKLLGIDIERFAPKDTKGIRHPLGVFDDDGHYTEFKTLGAKKYAYRDSKDGNIHITVSGVPKKASCVFNSLDEFSEGYIFKYKDTGKTMLSYNDAQIPVALTDYNGVCYTVKDLTGICMLPCTYKLGISEEYAEYIDETSKRAYFKE